MQLKNGVDGRSLAPANAIAGTLMGQFNYWVNQD
jgi:hypothetical protein